MKHCPTYSSPKPDASPANPYTFRPMPRFRIDRIDEYGQPYSLWESDDITEAWEQVDSLEMALDDAIQPRSGQLEAIIADLRDQIADAEAEAEGD